MKLAQFALFTRIFARKRYRRLVLTNRRLPFLYKIYIKNKAQIITEHFSFLTHRIYVYNGKHYIRCKISEARVGHRYGEFIRTKKQSRIIHKTDRNKRKAEKIYMKAHGMLKKQRRTK